MKCLITNCNKEAKLRYDDELSFCGKRHANWWFDGQLTEIKRVDK